MRLLTATYYILTDATGQIDYDVVSDPGNNIVIGGTDKNGEYQQFESEARHCHTWADIHGFTLTLKEGHLYFREVTDIAL